MPRIDIVKKVRISSSGRARQLEGLFDVPRKEQSIVEWHGDLAIDSDEWNVGLIIGPSGSGKSSILQYLFGKSADLKWKAMSIIDDFDSKKSMTDISEVCRAVGFNTIPSWLRPYSVLSNGERFRVELARRLLEQNPIIMDEFTSIVDRQVAKIAAHAAQKYVRKKKIRFVAASCHYDIVDWLQPDWILEPATMKFQRRSLRRRPNLEIEIARVPHSTCELFAPFHYLSAELAANAKCFGLFVDDRIAAFAGILHRPISGGRFQQNIFGVSRVVCLPDFQGLGLGPILCDRLGAAYKSLGFRFRNYPAHPGFVRTHFESENWRLIKRPGIFKQRNIISATSSIRGTFGGRPCATFEYCGPVMARCDAERLLT